VGLDEIPPEETPGRADVKRRFIPVAAPMLVGNERKYVLDCLKSTWISSNGEYLARFEDAFAKFCGVKHAIACCNGTAALHLALKSLGVGPGDEVIVPALTFIATANAVTYCAARPVFADSDPRTWNLDCTVLPKITSRTKGIIVVHLYGYPADMNPILSLAERHGLFVLEDAAEAHGATYDGRTLGSLGKMGVFSFYGNKIVTTGEGGMVVTDDDSLADQVRLLNNQGMDPARRYWFPVIGYNYRMTNIAAAIGLAQLEKVKWHMKRRQEIATWYQRELRDVKGISWQYEVPASRSAHWMFSILLDNSIQTSRDEVMNSLREQGIETRPLFYPIHMLPSYHESSGQSSLPVAERIGLRGISLPTWAGLKRQDVSYICEKLLKCLHSS